MLNLEDYVAPPSPANLRSRPRRALSDAGKRHLNARLPFDGRIAAVEYLRVIAVWPKQMVLEGFLPSLPRNSGTRPGGLAPLEQWREITPEGARGNLW